MHCPYCRHTDTRVLDSRVSEDGTAIRRRRTCNDCSKRFSTILIAVAEESCLFWRAGFR